MISLGLLVFYSGHGEKGEFPILARNKVDDTYKQFIQYLHFTVYLIYIQNIPTIPLSGSDFFPESVYCQLPFLAKAAIGDKYTLHCSPPSKNIYL